MEIPAEITYDGEIGPMAKRSMEKYGHILLPHIVPGSSAGTILEGDMDVEIVKNNPTQRNWYLFLRKRGFSDYGDRLFNVDHNEWPIRYALARTFTGINVDFDLKVTADMFDSVSFMCFPEAMEHILKAGYLDCTINWSQTDCLDLWATLDYPDHYPNRNVENIGIFYWYGQLDRNGILRGKLELRNDKSEKYNT